MSILPGMLCVSLEENGIRRNYTSLVEPVGGGMVAEAARISTPSGPIFVKWKENAPPRFFECEADGLNRLRAAGPLMVPEVIAWDDFNDDAQARGWVSFLALEWIEAEPPTDSKRFSNRFAVGLTQMHRQCAAPNGQFGLEVSNYLGSQPEDNAWCSSWAEFYRERRVLPQIRRARKEGRLPAYREQLLMTVVNKMDDLLEGLESRPCLVHGDLWSGNFIACTDEPVLIDPAVYYAEREVELAFIELFGGFPAGFMEAYNESYPLDSGYEYRRSLHQLYPLLIHLNHFGETYGPAVDQACRSYLG